jgi:hypothetical protein
MFNSIFADSKLKLNKCMEVIYSFCEGKSMRKSAENLGVKIHNVSSWFRKLECLLSNANVMQPESIGTVEDVYKVDE